MESWIQGRGSVFLFMEIASHQIVRISLTFLWAPKTVTSMELCELFLSRGEIHILFFFYHFIAYNIETMFVMIWELEFLHGNMVPHSMDPSFTFQTIQKTLGVGRMGKRPRYNCCAEWMEWKRTCSIIKLSG